jgi:hypothetical protein
MTRKSALAALFGLVVFSASLGVAQAETRYCLTGPVANGEDVPLRLLRVRDNEPRTHFVADHDASRPNCPGPGEACKRRGFLLPDDVVIAGPEINGYNCVTYIAPDVKKVKGKIAETNGFLPSGALSIVPLPPPKPEDWLGTWTRIEEGEITIKALAGGKLRVDGEATFGARDPERVKRGAVNLGSLEGEAMPKGNTIALGDGHDGTKNPLSLDMGGECLARLRLYGRYLVVEDNLGCGGMNVSFVGVYVRLK